MPNPLLRKLADALSLSVRATDGDLKIGILACCFRAGLSPEHWSEIAISAIESVKELVDLDDLEREWTELALAGHEVGPPRDSDKPGVNNLTSAIESLIEARSEPIGSHRALDKIVDCIADTRMSLRVATCASHHPEWWSQWLDESRRAMKDDSFEPTLSPVPWVLCENVFEVEVSMWSSIAEKVVALAGD